MTADPHALRAHLPWRFVVAGPAVAAVTLVAALIATAAAGVPLRDPHGVTLARLESAAMLVAVLVALDIVFRGGRKRWTAARALTVASALVSFYVTYLAYRNLKSVVPLLRPNELFDYRLAEIDRSLFAGSEPAGVLQSLFGTGISAHVLSNVYEAFFLFIPVAVAFALVALPDLRSGLFLTTALAINWLLAAGSYFLLPSLGPVYADATQFAQLPATGVSGLQHVLFQQRMGFLRDPSATGAAQSIGAFASLHCSIFFTAVLASHLLGLSRYVKIGVWVLFALTVVATIYFGWHYVLDDLAGVVIAVTALALARAIVGIDLRIARQRVPAPAPAAV
ncbi:MAG: phosphatase PAP2 family protein [Solirubrobacteraceae bacterium]